MTGMEQVFKLVNRKEKRTGSDYIATVTSVDGQTAYVQIIGSDIADTPVALTIDCNPGDTVRVRVVDGKAWITGNDTAPPGNTKKLVLSVDGKMDADMKNRASMIVIEEGTIDFRSNTIVIDSSNFKLDKEGNAVFGGKLEAAKGSFNGSVVFRFTESGHDSNLVYIGDESRSAPIRLEDDDSSSTQMTTDIWSGTYAQFMYDNGSAYAYNILTPGLMIMHEGNQTGSYSPTGFSGSSDVRLKEDIVNLDPDLAKRLRPVRFRFKGDDVTRYGFIAQEVQEILPGAVKENKEGYLGLCYQDIIAPLTALVLDQEKRILELEKTVSELKENPNGYVDT